MNGSHLDLSFVRERDELGEELGDGEVGVAVVDVERGDGERHDRTEYGTDDELERTPLQEAQSEAKEVVQRVRMLAQLVDIVHRAALLDDEVEGLARERLHHLDEAALERLVVAVDVDEYAAQVEEARVVIRAVHAHDDVDHVAEYVARVLVGGAEREAERATTRLGDLGVVRMLGKARRERRPHALHNVLARMLLLLLVTAIGGGGGGSGVLYLDGAKYGREAVEPVERPLFVL